MDLNVITVAGHGVFKVFRAEDLGLRTLQHSLTKRETTDFTCHCWLTGRHIMLAFDMACRCIPPLALKGISWHSDLLIHSQYAA